MSIRKGTRQVSRLGHRVIGWWSKRRLYQKTFIALFVAFFILTASASQSVMVHGYDGIVGNISSVEVDGEPFTDYDFYRGASVGIDIPWNGVLFAPDPTGVKCEIQAGVNVLEYQDLGEPITEEIDNKDGTFTYKTWEIQKAICTSAVTVVTYGVGLDAQLDTTFWITFSENEFSAFQEPDEVYAYILNIYTLENAQVVGIVDITPASGGYDIPFTTVTRVDVPQWLLDSGYTGAIGDMAEVKIPIDVHKIQPTSFVGMFRAESMATIMLGIDVFVAGYWEETKTTRGWEPPDPTPPWYAGILGFFDGFMATIGDVLGDIGLTFILPIAIIALVIFALYMMIRSDILGAGLRRLRQ